MGPVPIYSIPPSGDIHGGDGEKSEFCKYPYTPRKIQCSSIFVFDYHSLRFCLLQKYNALLESPTGTGKTLCLLGAGLAWLDYRKKLQEMPELRFDDMLKGTPDEEGM